MVSAASSAPGALDVGHVVKAVVERVDVEHIVFDAGDLPVRGDEVTPTGDSVGIGGSRLVEAFGGGGPPVDEDLLTLFVCEPDAADIGRGVFVDDIEATEAQSLLGAVEADELILVQCREGIAFGAVLVIASDFGDPHRAQAGCRLLPELIEAGIELVELDLLDTNF